MTSEEAFKLGFFTKCAEAGLSPTQVSELVKRASWPLAALGAATGLGTLAAYPVGALAAGALAAPPALGYVAGAGLAKSTDSNADPESLRTRELLEEYRRLARRIRKSREIAKPQEQ